MKKRGIVSCNREQIKQDSLVQKSPSFPVEASTQSCCSPFTVLEKQVMSPYLRLPKKVLMEREVKY